jgi:hypothetical protein
MEILVDFMKFVESLMRSGWIAVLGDNDATLQYYNTLCRELEPGDCVKVSIVLPDGSLLTYPFVRKSTKLQAMLRASDNDFEKLMFIEVRGDGGKMMEVTVFLTPDTSRVHDFAESIYRSLLMQLERVKMELVARNLPRM